MGRKRVLVLGVAGGSGSGKTTLVERILAALEPGSTARLEQDAYYRDRPDLGIEARAAINYDHPDSLDNDLLVAHVAALAHGQPVQRPVYDFVTYRRLPGAQPIPPAPVVIVDGILVLQNAALREAMDLKLYVDTDSDVRLVRRLRRDIRERGRTVESVLRQYMESVRPMHLQFVEPSKRYADVIIPEGGLNDAAVEMLVVRLRALM